MAAVKARKASKVRSCARTRSRSQLKAAELSAPLVSNATELQLVYEPIASTSKASGSIKPERVLKIRDSSLVLKVKRRTDLNQVEERSVFELFETNMRAMYEASQDGYDAKGKRKEVLDPEGRFLLARDMDGTLAGYAVWRFETDETADDREIPVLYCWELQIAEPYRGRGLAKRLMRCMEQIARAQQMDKVMLSVFNYNEAARLFYEKIGCVECACPSNARSYSIDEVDPTRCDDGPYEKNSDFMILSLALNS